MLLMGDWTEYTPETFLQMLTTPWGGQWRDKSCPFKESYGVRPDELEGKQLLAAGYWTGDCEGDMWMLARDTETGDLWESVEGHCSCNGILEGGIGWSTVLKEQLLRRTDRRSFGGNAKEREAIKALVESL